jgi:tetratricopeptide (TPR) repeat protein
MRTATSRWAPVAVLAGVICMVPFAIAQKSNRADVALEAAAKREMVDGDLKGAIDQYQKIVAEFSGTDRAAVAKALVRMGQCYEKLGSAEARKVYERAVRDFPDQKEMAAMAQGAAARAQPRAFGPNLSAGVGRTEGGRRRHRFSRRAIPQLRRLGNRRPGVA